MTFPGRLHLDLFAPDSVLVTHCSIYLIDSPVLRSPQSSLEPAWRAGQDLSACERFLCGLQEFLRPQLQMFFLPHTLPSPITLPGPARPGPAFAKAGIAAGSPRTPREKCRFSRARCKGGLFGYLTSSGNLCRVNLNIAVSCRLPRGPESTRKRKKRKKEPLKRLSCVFERIVLSESTVQMTPESYTCRYERVCACLDGTIVLTGFQFFHMTCLRGGIQEKAATVGFPLLGFIYRKPTTNRFPQPVYHGAAFKTFHRLTTV